MAKSQKRKKSATKVTRWLEGYRRNRTILLALGSLGTLLVSIPVLFLTWWVIWLVLFLPVTSVASLQTLGIATWVVLALLFVANVTANRQYLETFKFEEPSPTLAAARFAARVAGMSSLSLFMVGPDTMRSQVKMLSLLLLTGPSLIALSWRLGKAAFAAHRMDVQTVGLALSELLAAGKSVLVDDVTRTVGSSNPPQLLRELLLIDGVTLLTSGDPSLTLTDSLATEVSAGIESLETNEA